MVDADDRESSVPGAIVVGIGPVVEPGKLVVVTPEAGARVVVTPGAGALVVVVVVVGDAGATVVVVVGVNDTVGAGPVVAPEEPVGAVVHVYGATPEQAPQKPLTSFGFPFCFQASLNAENRQHPMLFWAHRLVISWFTCL